MADNPKKPFNLNAEPEPDILRDKDNTAPRYEPKLAKKKSAPNLAPSGYMGIRHGLPSKAKPKRFTYEKKNDVAKEFKSIAKPSPDKTHGHER